MSIDVRNEDLRVGDIVEVIGTWARIIEIRPYTGPLVDIIFAIAMTTPRSASFSLERRGWTTVERAGT